MWLNIEACCVKVLGVARVGRRFVVVDDTIEAGLPVVVVVVDGTVGPASVTEV